MLRPAKNGLLSVRVGVSNGISFLALLGDSVRLLSAIGTTIGRVMPYKLLLTGEFERAPHALCCMGDRVAAGARAVGAADAEAAPGMLQRAKRHASSSLESLSSSLEEPSSKLRRLRSTAEARYESAPSARELRVSMQPTRITVRVG